jgi:hypothetical protein
MVRRSDGVFEHYALGRTRFRRGPPSRRRAASWNTPRPRPGHCPSDVAHCRSKTARTPGWTHSVEYSSEWRCFAQRSPRFAGVDGREEPFVTGSNASATLAAWECPCDEYGCQNGQKTHNVHRATRLFRCRAMVGAPVLHSGPGIPLGGRRGLPSLDGESAVSLPALRPSGSLRPESMSSRPRWETCPGIPPPLFWPIETERTERTITRLWA